MPLKRIALRIDGSSFCSLRLCTRAECRYRLWGMNRQLEGEGMLAVQILVKRVVVAGSILQQKRSWPRLAGLVTTLDEQGV